MEKEMLGFAENLVFATFCFIYDGLNTYYNYRHYRWFERMFAERNYFISFSINLK